MTSGFCLLCTIGTVFLVLATACAEATREFEVGDEFGWHEPQLENSTMYIQWAERNRFQIGDTLRFEYKNDSVFMVDKWNYYHCNTTHYTVAFDNGNSTFKLDRSGPFYFISGNKVHCKNGQRLLVEVMSHHYRSPPFISLPPESASAMAPAPLSPLSSSAASVPAVTVSIIVTLSVTFVVSRMHVYIF